MATKAMFTVERVDGEVEIRLVPIPDSLEDEEPSGNGISFSRRDAVGFALKIIRAAI